MFGIPNKTEMTIFGDRILARSADAKEALEYIERVGDRIISKAKGLLPFNSLILAIIAILERSGIKKLEVLIGLSALCFAASSLILLMTIFTSHRFGDLEEYSTYEKEFRRTVFIACGRARILKSATMLSCLAFFLCALAVLIPALFDWACNAFEPVGACVTSIWAGQI